MRANGGRSRFFWLPLCAVPLFGCDGCSKTREASEDAAVVTIADASPLNATPTPTASIAAAVNPKKLPAYAGPTGSVEGTITVTGDPSPVVGGDFSRCPDGERTYGHAFREGSPKAPGGARWLADAVVAVTGYGDFFVQEKDEAEEVAIAGCAFSTRTVTMTFGQRLEVKNLTKEFWTPKLEPVQSAVLMMAPPGGDAVKLYPKVAGHYHLIDHDRKWAVDDLYVFLHPLHTSSAVEGHYRIDGVPVGKVTVNTSHPRIQKTPSAGPQDLVTASTDVEIKAGVVSQIDLTLVYKAPPAPPSVDAGPPIRLR